MDRLGASQGPAVLLIDDREMLSPDILARFDTVLEPEELLPDGTDAFEGEFHRAVNQWLLAIFPGTLDGVPLAELLWCNVFLQPHLADRLNQAAIATEVWRRFDPRHVVLSTPPPLCELVAATAQYRGLLSSPPPLTQWMFRAQQFGRALGSLAVHTARLFARVRHRRDKFLEPRIPEGTIDPEIWAAVPGKWPHPGRHVVESFIAPSLEAGRSIGLAFEQTFRDGKNPNEEGESLILSRIKEASDGKRPTAIDQVVGLSAASDLLPALASWIPLYLRAIFSTLIHADTLRIDGVHLSTTSDLPPLLRILGNDLLRTVEARIAARRFLLRHPALRTMVFALANVGEAKIVDILLQRAGVTTVDFQHAYFSDGCIGTQFRSSSTVLASWTQDEARRFAHNRTNARCEGGFMPRRLPAPRTRTIEARPTVIVLSNYLTETNLEFRRRHSKYARRLAAALGALQRQLGGEINVILRLHPHEDRAAWQTLLDENGATAPLSDVQDLADDLERSDVAVVGASSAAIEALLHHLPIVFFEGPLVSRSSILGQLPSDRRFKNGAQLIQAIKSILAVGCRPELGPLESCFGPTLAPRAFTAFVDQQKP